jgi:uncharacterized membrane protein YhaH (DUF805 family)
MISTFTWYFLSLSGRLTRQEFWLGSIGLFAVMVVLIRMLPNLALHDQADPMHRAQIDHTMRWSALVALVIVFWPLTVIFVKRLHDLNLSGRWMFGLLAIPLVAKTVHLPPLAVVLVAVALIGFIPGTPGNNRFGLDPLSRGGGI